MQPNFKDIPGIEKKILIQATDVAPKNGEATSVILSNGDILLLWSEFLNTDLLSEHERPPASPQRRDASSDDGYARISGVVSSNGGETWSAPRVIVDDRDAGVNCMSPGLTRLADGRLLLAYSWRNSGNHAKGKSGEAAKMVRISGDNGLTWSTRKRITPDDGKYHTGCHHRALTLASGRVVVQCHTIFPALTKQMGNYVVSSADNGDTWQRSEVLTEKKLNCLEEGSIVERADGTLLMLMRSLRGQSFYTESDDEGLTWSEPYPSGIVTPAAPSLLVRIPDSSDLLLVWNSNFNPDETLLGLRCPLLCAVSLDGGRSWGLPKALETDTAYWWEYPSLIFHKGHALVHYRRFSFKRDQCALVQAKIPLTWFYEN